jgi:hypothetical protein
MWKSGCGIFQATISTGKSRITSVRINGVLTEIRIGYLLNGKQKRYRLSQLPHFVYSIFFFLILSGVGLSPLGTAATTGLLYQPQMIDDGDCGAIGGRKTGRGNRSTRRKPA